MAESQVAKGGCDKNNEYNINETKLNQNKSYY